LLFYYSGKKIKRCFSIIPRGVRRTKFQFSRALAPYVITVKKRVENKDIDRAIKNILSSQTDYYFELFGKLSQYQKKLLLALKENGNEVFSKNYSDKFDLSSASSTQRALNKLIFEGIVEKENNRIVFSDPFFKRFLHYKKPLQSLNEAIKKYLYRR